MRKSAFVFGLTVAFAAAEMLNACSGDDVLVSDEDAGAGGDATFPTDAGSDSGIQVVDAGSDTGAPIVDAGSDSAIVVVDSGPFVPFDAGPPPIINGCHDYDFADHTDGGAVTLDWGFNIEDDPNHCTLIRPGQSVSWLGDMTTHPLGPYDGRDDAGAGPANPITVGTATGDTTVTINFPTAGLYGYWCMVHQTMMMGAIDVEPAPPIEPVDAGDAGDDAGDGG